MGLWWWSRLSLGFLLVDRFFDFSCGDAAALALSVDEGCWWLFECDVALHLDAQHQLCAGSAHGVVRCSCGPCAYSSTAGAAIVVLGCGCCDVLLFALWWSCPVEDVLKFGEQVHAAFVVLV